MNFFGELKQRHIYRVGAAYAVVAWVLLQLVANVAPILDLPPWVARTILLLLVICFPVALIFAWVHELTPDSGTLTRLTTGKLDWALMAALLVVIALVSYQQFASAPTARTEQAQQTGVEAARAASTSPAGAIGIAVLPFTNLSGDPTQEFFSDGMTEEITTALAKISDLRVVARTSAYQFKGEKKDMRALGQALGASHLLEGSVRKAGTRVRITAQLIKADDGTHIWTENYDRELTDIFAIQEEIATAIAGALRMPLGLAPGERLVSSRAIDAESYQEYLRAKPLVQARSRGIAEATNILEPLVARNPGYAPALALMGQVYSLQVNYARQPTVDTLRRTVDTYFPKAEAAAQMAIQLDPTLADGYWALGGVVARRGKWAMAEELYSKALALDPNNPEALSRYSNLLANVGRLKEALAMKQQVLALEPYVPGYRQDAGEALWLNGQNDAAIAMLKALPPDVVAAQIDLAQIYASTGHYSEGADVVQKINLGSGVPPSVGQGPAIAERLLRTAPMPSASPQSLPHLAAFGFIYLHIGAAERALEYYEETAEAGFFSPGGMDNAFVWHPSYAGLRKTERFKAWIRKVGYPDYWRAKGWPEFCHPTTGDDFICA